MRAAICPGPDLPLVIEEVGLSDLGRNDILVSVEASGICHSDLFFAKGWAGSAPEAMLLGHEGAGTVLEVGPDVTRCEVGDRVIGTVSPSCGTCWPCLRGMSNHCEQKQTGRTYAVSRPQGGSARAMAGLGTFAEMMAIHENSAVMVRSDLPSEQLALIGCAVTTGVGAALWTAKVPPGATAAVFGCGGVGQGVVQGLRIAGAARVFGVDPVELKRTTAELLGATDVIDPTQVDPIESLLEATGGRGVDFAFEVVGNTQVIGQAFASVGTRGTVVILGMPTAQSTFSVPLISLLASEKRILGSTYGSAQARVHVPLLVEFAERGQLDLAAMVTRRIGLDAISDGFRALEAGEVIRSVIV